MGRAALGCVSPHEIPPGQALLEPPQHLAVWWLEVWPRYHHAVSRVGTWGEKRIQQSRLVPGSRALHSPPSKCSMREHLCPKHEHLP